MLYKPSKSRVKVKKKDRTNLFDYFYLNKPIITGFWTVVNSSNVFFKKKCISE